MWKKIGKAAKDTWTFLDGKKTAIGTVCLIVSEYIPPHTTAYAILKITGTIFGGVGVLAKANKADQLPEGMRKSTKMLKKTFGDL